MSDEMMLFDMEPDWKDYWWGMPEFSPASNNKPAKQVIINFPTVDDYEDFLKITKIRPIRRGNGDAIPSTWFPEKISALKDCYYDSIEKINTRYPVCIMSKGRADCQTTGKLLDRMGVKYKFFVEETEGDLYKQHLGEDKVIVMPFHDLGQGSIPARNFIWEWALTHGFKRHWVMDDNLVTSGRFNHGARRRCFSSAVFRAIEDFCDRYQNIAIAGPNHENFMNDFYDKPVIWNTRIYSCSLIDTSLPHRWRGRYNEDTDLCLRLLKDGYCSAQFNVLFIKKAATAGSKGKALKGGNTDNVYNTGDHRRAFAESLKEQHPDVVEVVWKLNRWHHQVDYSKFKKNKPILKDGITPRADMNEYGMEIRKRK